MGFSSSKYYFEPKKYFFERMIEPYFSSYQSIKMILYNIKISNQLSTNVYLISTKSIPNFINIIIKSKIFTDPNFQENISKNENKLKKLFLNYELEKNIKILYKYEECLSLIEQKNEEINEFIIVDDSFIKNMQITYQSIEQMKVELKINKKKNIQKIFFPATQKAINIKQKTIAFFKFKNKSNINEEIYNMFNPKTIIKRPKIKMKIGLEKGSNEFINNYNNEENKKDYLERNNPIPKKYNQFENFKVDEKKLKKAEKFSFENNINNNQAQNLIQEKVNNNKFNYASFDFIKKKYENNYKNILINKNQNYMQKSNKNYISATNKIHFQKINSNKNNNYNNIINNYNNINDNNNYNNIINNYNNINDNNKNNYYNNNNNNIINNNYNQNNNYNNSYSNNLNNNNNFNYNFNNNLDNNNNFNYNFNNNLNNNNFNYNFNNNLNNNNNFNYNFNNNLNNNNFNYNFNNNNFNYNFNNNLNNNNNILRNNNNNLFNNNTNNNSNMKQLSYFNIIDNNDKNDYKLDLNNKVNNNNNYNFNNNIIYNKKNINNNNNNLIIYNNKNLINNQNDNDNLSRNNKLLINNYTHNNSQNDNKKNINNKSYNNYTNTSIKNYKYPPLIGLENLGNTCYMNAPLQCLSNISQLTDYFLSNKQKFLNIKKYTNQMKVTKAYSEVIYNLWDENNKNRSFKPAYFKEIIGKENIQFKGNDANDSKDLILFLYSRMHEELNEKNKNSSIEKIDSDKTDPEIEYYICKDKFERRNKSIISDLFYFDQVFITECRNCGVSEYDFNIYNIMLFPLEKARLYKEKKQNNFAYINIIDCFESYTSTERNKEKRKIMCKSCHKKSEYFITTKISTFPKILTIILNRGHNLEFNVEFEINYYIEDLYKYMINLDGNKNESNFKYELIGIVIHTGESGINGHFLTYCKSPINRKWYSYNDTKIELLIDPIGQISGIPYLLFYQKI